MTDSPFESTLILIFKKLSLVGWEEPAVLLRNAFTQRSRERDRTHGGNLVFLSTPGKESLLI